MPTTFPKLPPVKARPYMLVLKLPPPGVLPALLLGEYVRPYPWRRGGVIYLEPANRSDGRGFAWLSFSRWLAVSGVAKGPEF